MVQRFKDQVTQSLRVPGPGVVESGEGSKEKKPYTSTRMLQIQNFFRINHSVNQQNIYGAVSNWSGQLGQSPNETEPTSERFTTNEESVNQDILRSVNSLEVNSLVDSSRSERASGNRLRENL